MRPENRTTFVVAVLFTLLVFAGLAANGSARADPPVRAARIAYITGNTSFALLNLAGEDRRRASEDKKRAEDDKK